MARKFQQFKVKQLTGLIYRGFIVSAEEAAKATKGKPYTWQFVRFNGNKRLCPVLCLIKGQGKERKRHLIWFEDYFKALMFEANHLGVIEGEVYKFIQQESRRIAGGFKGERHPDNTFNEHTFRQIQIDTHYKVKEVDSE